MLGLRIVLGQPRRSVLPPSALAFGSELSKKHLEANGRETPTAESRFTLGEDQVPFPDSVQEPADYRVISEGGVSDKGC